MKTELPTPPPGFEGVSEQLTDLPKVLKHAWASMMPLTLQAADMLHQHMPAQTIPCRKCDGGTRELLIDRSVAVTAKEGHACARYEPCKACLPFAWFRARSENMGVPPMQPLCCTRRDNNGEVIECWLREPDASLRSAKLYITGDRRKGIHSFVMMVSNGWFLEQQALETCMDLEAPQVLQEACALPWTLALAISPFDRGEHLQQILTNRTDKQRTWIIDPEGCAESLIPDNFYRVKI